MECHQTQTDNLSADFCKPPCVLKYNFLVNYAYGSRLFRVTKDPEYPEVQITLASIHQTVKRLTTKFREVSSDRIAMNFTGISAAAKSRCLQTLRAIGKV